MFFVRPHPAAEVFDHIDAITLNNRAGIAASGRGQKRPPRYRNQSALLTALLMHARGPSALLA